ncbi:MAG TPA: acyl-CoA dehydrogenase family protein, partial [Pseudonocardia sp.]|nr:acyl-CoA dehydrogenase family protein [Pseudonocardia sp.]
MSVDSALRASLRAQAREFAGDVLTHARAVTDPLSTATERYRATRPFYRQMVEAGFLRRLIPQALGGDGTGASATAALAEELVAGDPSVALNLFSTGLGPPAARRADPGRPRLSAVARRQHRLPPPTAAGAARRPRL